MPRILRRFPRCCIPPTIWESNREDGLQDSLINPNWYIIRFLFTFAGYDFECGKATVKEEAPFVKEYVPDIFLDSSTDSSGSSVEEFDSSIDEYVDMRYLLSECLRIRSPVSAELFQSKVLVLKSLDLHALPHIPSPKTLR
ncbi:hypothetical protein B9Z55_011237 [Caenorhabditis nigoni]|uniref:Uncharacterized protein n=1 Tax=Caenorhabditis nigoni TaxID=1611254 RepID=A0A2G5UJ73_9PELO|nr:hypothetical protein B9Z55_011237 [Caenorhabditis nigoni]